MKPIRLKRKVRREFEKMETLEREQFNFEMLEY